MKIFGVRNDEVRKKTIFLHNKLLFVDNVRDNFVILQAIMLETTNIKSNKSINQKNHYDNNND